MDIYHLGLVVWSVFESVLCTAAIFGWAQLLEILEGEQYFSSYCGDEAKSNKTISQLNTSNYINNETDGNDINTCSEQDSILRLVYTIAVFASFASIFLSGKYMDMFGFRKTRILASFIHFLAGGAMFMSTYGMHEMLFPGLILTAIGGGFYMSTLVKHRLLIQGGDEVEISEVAINVGMDWSPLENVCGVLPRRRYTAISVINGAIDSSAVMLLIFKLCYNAGISFKTIIIVYYSFVFGHGLLFTFTIFPKDLPDSTNTVIGNGRSIEEDSNSRNTGLKTDTDGQLKNEKVFNIMSGEGRISLLSIIRGPTFIIHTCFFSISSLRSFIFTGTVNTLLKRLTNDEEKVDFYLTILGLIQFTGVVLAFVPGFLLDWSPAGRHRNFSIIISFVLTGLISILVTVGLLIPVLELQIFNFFLYSLLRTFLYSTHSSFIMKNFPLYHAGALVGFSYLIAAVVSLSQIPIFVLMDGPYKGDPTWVNVGLLVIQILVMVHPVYLWKCSKDEKKCSKNTLEIIYQHTNLNNSDTTDLKSRTGWSTCYANEANGGRSASFHYKRGDIPHPAV